MTTTPSSHAGADDAAAVEGTASTGPGRPRIARAALLAVVFVCAACGLVYELALVSLGSFLIGNTATQASIVLAVMVFAMGVGSLAAKPLQPHSVTAFAVIELALALLGGHRRVGLLAAPLVGGRPVLVVRCRHVLEAQTLKKREAFPCTQWAARLRADPLANLQLRVLVVHKVFFVADVRLRER